MLLREPWCCCVGGIRQLPCSLLLRAKVRKINSKSLEVGAAEERRLLRGGEYRLLRGALSD